MSDTNFVRNYNFQVNECLNDLINALSSKYSLEKGELITRGLILLEAVDRHLGQENSLVVLDREGNATIEFSDIFEKDR